MIGNLILETCASPSNSATINLAGAVAGRSTFRSQLANGSTVGYCLSNSTQWEVGLGTLTHATPDTLARTTVLSNHLGTTDRVVFVGSAYVINHIPAEKAVYLNSAGNLEIANDVAVTGNITAADGTTGDEVVNFSQFAQSKAGDGYVTLPGNIRMQWGTESVTLSGNSATISFPSTFSSFYTLVVSNGSASTSQNDVTITGQNGTEFIVYVPDQATGSFVVNWIAIGAV